jgi:hypothetical protein
MPPPRAPPAAAAPVKTRDVCDLCGDDCAAEGAEEDVVEVVCNQPACVDGRGSLYHRACLLTHIEKSGAVRKTHGGKADMRQILRMDLTGARAGVRGARGKGQGALFCACFRGRLAPLSLSRARALQVPSARAAPLTRLVPPARRARACATQASTASTRGTRRAISGTARAAASTTAR